MVSSLLVVAFCCLRSGLEGITAKILDFRFLFNLKHLKFKGWISRAHSEFVGDLESTDLSRDNLSREIGHMNFRGCETTVQKHRLEAANILFPNS